MLFDSLDTLARVALAAAAAYVALIVILRTTGKRTLAKLNAFDFAVTVAFGSTLATVILSRNVALADGILAFAMLAGLQYAVTKLSLLSHGFRRLVRSNPRLLVEDGRYVDAAMKRERVTRSELDAVLRSNGVGRIEEVAALVLETDGSFSVIRDNGAGELTVLRSVERG